METITSAAILYNGQVWTGKDHATIGLNGPTFAPNIGDAYNKAYLQLGRSATLKNLLGIRVAIQGFVTSENRFVDRKQAAKIALASKQIERLHFMKDELDSADINYSEYWHVQQENIKKGLVPHPNAMCECGKSYKNHHAGPYCYAPSGDKNTFQPLKER